MGEMLNNIAHQWRQPLNNIAIYVQNMQMLRESQELSDEQLKSDVGSVMELVKYMSKTIDDFRTFFRNEKQKKEFVVKDAVEQALRFVAARMEHFGIGYQLVVRQESTIVGYQTEYTQVLLNILNNAIDALQHATFPDRQIVITMDKQAAKVIVIICDNGGGIAPEVLPHIFEPYYTTKGPSEGTGIGLYMSKVIVEKHMSGTLTARNTADGTELVIEIDTAQGDRETS
jgi:C4-dicarboxylate-specific signal transduction histidine kinase